MSRSAIVIVLATAALSTAPGVGADELAKGRAVYQGTCIACHGDDGAGTLPGVPDLSDRTGPLSKPDAVLIEHITEGFQSPGSPMAMPPKGGDPNLTEQDIRAVLEYLRSRFGS